MHHRILVPAILAAGLVAADPTNAAGPSVPTGETASGASRAMHSWELPPLVVTGERLPGFAEDDLVGDYGQPRWSTRRRFSEVRTYVIPKGQFDFEYWLKISQPSRREYDEARSNGEAAKPSVKQIYEAEMGLGHRIQLDLYQVYKKDGSNGQNKLDATKFEVRYALADWDVIPGNPTLYAEWEQAAEGADSVEAKLLTCGDIGNRWSWANNLVYEQKTGDERDRGLECNTAVGYLAIDGVLSVGVETAIAHVSALDGPGETHRNTHNEISVGPSIRWNPIPQAHIILTEFIGATPDTSTSSTTAIFGWEF